MYTIMSYAGSSVTMLHAPTNDKEDLAFLIGKEISLNTTGLFRSLANYMIRKQNINSSYNSAYLSGLGAIEEIIDKNYLQKYGLSLSKGSNVIIKRHPEDPLTSNQIIVSVLEDLIKLIPSDIEYKMYTLLMSIASVLIAIEEQNDVDLSAYKPVYNDWMEIGKIFGKSNFKIGQRVSQTNGVVYFIYVAYKGLTLIVLETTNKLVRIDEAYQQQDYSRFLSPAYFMDTFTNHGYQENTVGQVVKKMLNNNLNNLTKKYGNTHPISKKPHSETRMILQNEAVISFNEDYAVFEINNDTNFKLINFFLASYEKYLEKRNTQNPEDIQHDNAVDAFRCYTGDGFKDVNTYLIQNEIFNDDGTAGSKSLNYTNTPACKIPPKEMVRLMGNCMGKAFQEKKIPDDLAGLTFNVVRCTYPSVYNGYMIEDFEIGHMLTFPTITSTAYRITSYMQKFTTIDTPAVVFYIRVTGSTMWQNFMFVDSVSMYNGGEFEIVFKNGTTFEVVNRIYMPMYFNDDYTGENIVKQKLVLCLVISGDDNAKQSILDDPVYGSKATAYVYDKEVIGAGVQTQSENSKSVSSSDVFLLDNDQLNKQINKKQTEKNQLFIFVDSPYDKHDPVDKNVEPDLSVILPYYLRSKSGIKLKKPLLGYHYLDPDIMSILPKDYPIHIPNNLEIVNMPHDTSFTKVMDSINEHSAEIRYMSDEQKDNITNIIATLYFNSNVLDAANDRGGILDSIGSLFTTKTKYLTDLTDKLSHSDTYTSVLGGSVLGGSVLGGSVLGGSVLGGSVLGGSVLGGAIALRSSNLAQTLIVIVLCLFILYMIYCLFIDNRLFIDNGLFIDNRYHSKKHRKND